MIYLVISWIIITFILSHVSHGLTSTPDDKYCWNFEVARKVNSNQIFQSWTQKHSYFASSSQPCIYYCHSQRNTISSLLLCSRKLTWVMGSFITSTSVTVPNCPKYSLRRSWLVCHDSPPTNNFPGAESEEGVLRPLDSPCNNLLTLNSWRK